MVELAENRDLGPPGYMKHQSASGFLGPVSPYPKIVQRNREEDRQTEEPFNPRERADAISCDKIHQLSGGVVAKLTRQGVACFLATLILWNL